MCRDMRFSCRGLSRSRANLLFFFSNRFFFFFFIFFPFLLYSKCDWSKTLLSVVFFFYSSLLLSSLDVESPTNVHVYLFFFFLVHQLSSTSLRTFSTAVSKRTSRQKKGKTGEKKTRLLDSAEWCPFFFFSLKGALLCDRLKGNTFAALCSVSSSTVNRDLLLFNSWLEFCARFQCLHRFAGHVFSPVLLFNTPFSLFSFFFV